MKVPVPSNETEEEIENLKWYQWIAVWLVLASPFAMAVAMIL